MWEKGDRDASDDRDHAHNEQSLLKVVYKFTEVNLDTTRLEWTLQGISVSFTVSFTKFVWSSGLLLLIYD